MKTGRHGTRGMRDRAMRDFDPTGETDVQRTMKGLKAGYNLANKIGVVPLPVSAVIDPIAAFTAPLRAVLRTPRQAHEYDL